MKRDELKQDKLNREQDELNNAKILLKKYGIASKDNLKTIEELQSEGLVEYINKYGEKLFSSSFTSKFKNNEIFNIITKSEQSIPLVTEAVFYLKEINLLSKQQRRELQTLTSNGLVNIAKEIVDSPTRFEANYAKYKNSLKKIKSTVSVLASMLKVQQLKQDDKFQRSLTKPQDYKPFYKKLGGSVHSSGFFQDKKQGSTPVQGKTLKSILKSQK